MPIPRNSFLKIVIPLLIGLILVWYSLSKISFSDLLNYAQGANYWYVLIGVCLGVVSHVSRAYRWLYMAKPLGCNPRFMNSFMAVYSAYLVNLTIPRAGEVARATILSNYEHISFEKGFGTIVAERVADTIMLMVVMGVALSYQHDYLTSFLFERFDLKTLSVLIMIGAVFSGGIFLFIKRSGTSIAGSIRKFLKGLVEGVMSIFKMEHKWPFIAHTIFIWVMYVLMFYTTSLAISDLGGISLGAILVGFILASFSIAATNGGIGSFPEAVVIAFTLFGVPEDPSRAFGWIMWTAQTLVIIVFGGLSLLYLPLYNRKHT